MVGMELDSVEEVSKKRMSAKLKAIMDNPFHPLCVKLRRLRSTFDHRLVRRRSSKHLAGSPQTISHQTPVPPPYTRHKIIHHL